MEIASEFYFIFPFSFFIVLNSQWMHNAHIFALLLEYFSNEIVNGNGMNGKNGIFRIGDIYKLHIIKANT